MTEWWVSQKKHFCDYCKVWTGGHLWQIRKHEEGRMHQEKKELYLKNCRQREKDRQREEQDLKKQLAEIERAAKAAMDQTPYAEGGEAEVEDEPPPPPKAEASRRPPGRPGPPGPPMGPPGGPMGAPMGAPGVPAPPGPPGALEAVASVDVQKAVIQHMVLEAKRRKVQAEGAERAEPKPVAEGSPWLVCTDPKSGAVYYYNKETKVSAWQKPEPDLSQAPPPPAKAPPPPARPGCVGVWQEVLPEESMWSNREEVEAASELDVEALYQEPEEIVNPIAELKSELGGRKGTWADEDLEKHEKQMEQKRSLTTGSATFPMNRKKASGIRKKREDD